MADSLEVRVKRLEQSESRAGNFEQDIRALLPHITDAEIQLLEPEIVGDYITLHGLEILIAIRKRDAASQGHTVLTN
jgi:hypothetical protein